VVDGADRLKDGAKVRPVRNAGAAQPQAPSGEQPATGAQPPTGAPPAPGAQPPAAAHPATPANPQERPDGQRRRRNPE
jgi:hypothetical protein